MQERMQAIRRIARELLESGRVDCVIGYAAASTPLRARPFVATTPEEADRLIWNDFCGLNLASMASGRAGNMAVVAQGCVSRNLNLLIQENRLERERLVVIGVPCLGMLDRFKVEAKFPGAVIESVAYVASEQAGHEDGGLVVRGTDSQRQPFEEQMLRRDVKRDNCYTCQHRNPVVADELAAEAVPETGGGDIDMVAAPWERLDPEQRWERFTATFADCIRCYACRDACPLCYCNMCFVDESRPQWLGKTRDDADVYGFHLLRAFHCAGRCTDCGACETACPMGIKMRRLTSKLEKDVRAMFGASPGMDADTKPPLARYNNDDPEGHFT